MVRTTENALSGVTQVAKAQSDRVRRHAFFSGSVQGVGFRFTVQSIARQFQVTGFVRNLPDGRVELVAEGTGPELNRFVDEISATMARHISEATTTDGPATGEFASFTIAF